MAGGALLTYVWASFPVPPEGDDTARIDLVSNSVFGAVALVILLLAVRRTLDWTKIGRGTTQEAHTQPGR